LSACGKPLYLFSFPTRRSSDLVTLYGIVDAGIGYQQLKGTYIDPNDPTMSRVDYDGKRTGMINGINSANRWGLKGTEDLGNGLQDRKSTRLNSSHVKISYAVFC